MKRLVMSLAIASSAVLVGCGGGEVVIEAQLVGQTAGDGAPATTALSDLPIRLLPYDRDLIFDSLEAAYPEPQPAIPDSLAKLQDAVAAAQREWQAAESAWSVARDSLQRIAAEMEGLSRAEARYRLLFADFQELEQEEQSLRRQMDAAFERFTQLQSSYVAQSEEVSLLRQQWADDAFAPVDSIIAARLEALGLEELADTTGAGGVVRINVPPGNWWVHARYELPYEELYWNIPIQVQRGDSILVRLDQETAQVRSNL